MSLAHNKEKDINVQIDTFISELKRRQISGSYPVALATSQLLLRVVSASRWNHIDQLLTQIRALGKRLQMAQPREFACGNIVRRVLAIIRDEMEGEKIQDDNSALISSMFSLLSSTDGQQKGSVKQTRDLRPSIIEGIQDLIDEIGNIDEGIAGIAVELIHDNEILLCPTPGSKTVARFLLRACQKRKFTVIITESFPNETKEAHEFAKRLAKAGIETVIIPDTIVYAVMSRVGKVIMGTRAVFANGGCVASSGVSNVCHSAKEHKTPVFVVGGLYKLSPTHPFNAESLIEMGNSGLVVPFQDSEIVETVEVVNPVFDYVPPEFIDIYITNIGGYSPDFMYRIVLDNYRPEDVTFD